jgi:pteridine reductase
MTSADNKQPVALVTGAARRIGAAISSTLHAAGYRLVLHCNRSRNAAMTLADQLCAERADSARVVSGELGQAGAGERIFSDAMEPFGRVDLLVNNASSFFATPIGKIDEEDWDQLFASNARGPLFLCQAAAAELRLRQGAIINIGDIHAQKPMARHTVYCMAKAALQMMTLSLARELGPAVRVNAVAPGAILWPEGDEDQEQQRKILDRTALKRTGDPDDIARAVLYLARDGGYVTGQILAVDGGRSLNI